MSMREHDNLVTPSEGAPLTRREARAQAENSSKSKSRSQPAPPTRRRATPAQASGASRPPASQTGSAGPKRTTTSARRNTPSRMLSLAAMVFAGALLVGMSVPANAFISDASASAPDVLADKVPGQTLAVSSEAALAETPRDSYEVISYAEQLRLKYPNVSYSYSATTGAIRWPFPYQVPISDGFGWRPNPSGVGEGHHNGLDFTPGGGSPIYAVADGTVVLHSDEQYGYGNHVILTHNVNGLVFDSLYAHMLTGSSPLNAGDPIKVGDFIGLVGDTGNSYGAHLHLEIRVGGAPIDPFPFLTTNAVN